MKVGDLVRWHQVPLLKRRLGCLPDTQMEEERWSVCGLVHEVCGNGNISVLWPDKGLELVDSRYLETVNESR